MSRLPSTPAIITALHTTLGKVSLAAERLNCSAEAIYARARSSPELQAVLRFYRGKLLDAAESALWKAAIEGESWAVKWVLDSWGQSRLFSDGAETWHAPHQSDDEPSPAEVTALVREMLKDEAYTAAQRKGRRDCFSGEVRPDGERGPLENGAAPGGDRPRDRRNHHGTNGADPGH